MSHTYVNSGNWECLDELGMSMLWHGKVRTTRKCQDQLGMLGFRRLWEWQENFPIFGNVETRSRSEWHEVRMFKNFLEMSKRLGNVRVSWKCGHTTPVVVLGFALVFWAIAEWWKYVREFPLDSSSLLPPSPCAHKARMRRGMRSQSLWSMKPFWLCLQTRGPAGRVTAIDASV